MQSILAHISEFIHFIFFLLEERCNDLYEGLLGVLAVGGQAGDLKVLVAKWLVKEVLLSAEQRRRQARQSAGDSRAVRHHRYMWQTLRLATVC